MLYLLNVALVATAIDATPVLPLDAPIIERGGLVMTAADFDGSIAHIPNKDRWAYVNDSERFSQHLSSAMVTLQLASKALKTGITPETPPLDQDLPKLRQQILVATYKRKMDEELTEEASMERAEALFAADGPHDPIAEKRKATFVYLRDSDYSLDDAKELLNRALSGEALSSLAPPVGDNPSKQSAYYHETILSAATRDYANPVSRRLFEADGPEVFDDVISLQGFHVLAELVAIEPARAATMQDERSKYINLARQQLYQEARNKLLVRHGVPLDNEEAAIETIASIAEAEGLYGPWEENWMQYETKKQLVQQYLTQESADGAADWSQLARERYLIEKHTYRSIPVYDLMMIQFSSESQLAQDAANDEHRDVNLATWLARYPDDAYQARPLRNARLEQLPDNIRMPVAELQEVGQVTSLVVNGETAAVFELTALQPERQLTFEEAEPQIVAELKNKHQDKKRRLIIDQVKSMEAVLHHDNIATLLDRYHQDNRATLQQMYADQ
ncbi:MAG: hypothetical protein DHS20C11_24130 [Lysobacteraceae bacterium]|nr:MAG: hypothetical protein DHS20C11_24130 [Xanthomonadaceae bacterium]